MKRDFNFWVLVLAFGMPLLFLAFIAGLYFIPCGFNNDCSQATLPDIIHTPIPTILPATIPAPGAGGGEAAAGDKCLVQAMTLLEAWINSGYSEAEPFEFTDTNGASCRVTYADVQGLFSEGNLWYNGAPACITCHNANIAVAAAQMDLSSYAGIVSGSRRASADVTGNDILGGGVWELSKLLEALNLPSGSPQAMPLGRPPEAFPPGGPLVLVGQQVSNP